MPTLQDITLAHSRRLSEIARDRDLRLAEARSLRDLHLRALPPAAKCLKIYDDDLLGAREKQEATDARAEAARGAALRLLIDQRADRFEEAHAARRAADTDAMQAKRRADDAAQRKYESALADLRDVPPAARPAAVQDAERARRLAVDAARQAHDDALAASQQKYRAAIDQALQDERRAGRDAERAYLDALKVGDAAIAGATAFADQALAGCLAAIPEAAAILRSWQAALATIASDAVQAERDAFARFRRDLDALTA